LAATNRWRLTPRMIDQDSLALRALVRNARLETALGVFVLMTVAWLGITVPAAHESIAWPFAYTLSFESAHHVPGLKWLIAAVAAGALVFAGFIFRGAWRHRRRLTVFGVSGLALASIVALGLIVVPAYPTTYVAPPVRYNVDAVVRGAQIYAQSCASCHGPDAHGDGPAAASLAVKPVDLDQHVSFHRPGELYWMIAHGKPERSMPAFSPAIADKDIWSLVRFLRAKADAEEAIGGDGERNAPMWQPVAAPDFTFEFPDQGQESLQELRSGFAALVVFFTLPQSAERLAALSRAHHMLAREGLRTIALPVTGAAAPVKLEGVPESEWIFPIAGANVANAYAIFARDPGEHSEAPPAHMEFLIDRGGYIRARWLGLPDSESERMAQLHKQLEILSREKIAPVMAEHHGH